MRIQINQNKSTESTLQTLRGSQVPMLLSCWFLTGPMKHSGSGNQP